jgi:ADP-L-glycero-D-manno-heptose 6-epimerase
MIVVTGAAGFISSCLVEELNQNGYKDIVVVDDFSREDKNKNLEGKTLVAKVPRKDFFKWAKDFKDEIDFVFHLGARTDTTEFDKSIFDELNVQYSKNMWNFCTENNIPLVYASSAATYGMGENGYKDDHGVVEKLKPLNPYGDSKNDFDKWVLKQEKTPPFWAGLKFFNVYGPNEFHKGRMASVIFHAFNQISNTNGMKLFASHNPDYKNGEQLRDFVYVKDVVSVCMYLMNEKPKSGLYNLGTGKARTFLDLAKATFKAMGKEENISFIPTPEDIRDKYQYFTEADMTKLISSGYSKPFSSLEEGVEDYVKNHLIPNKYM